MFRPLVCCAAVPCKQVCLNNIYSVIVVLVAHASLLRNSHHSELCHFDMICE